MSARLPADDPKVTGSLRVATYNLLHGINLAGGRVELDAAADAIAALDVDVVALQEVDRGLERSGGIDQVALLAQRLGWHGAFAPALLGDPGTTWGVAEADGGKPGYGVGLLSRLPLAGVARRLLPGGGPGRRTRPASPDRPGWDREPRVALRARVDVAGTAVTVTTTHLSYLPWRGLAQLQAAGRFAAEGEARALLLGDLNLPVWGVRLWLRGWQHAGGAATYPAWDPRMQTDQLLVRGPLRVSEAMVGSAATSDHLPLTASVDLAPAS